MRMFNRFAVFLFGASLLSALVIAQSAQPHTPPTGQTPLAEQATQPTSKPEPPAETVSDPAKGVLQPQQPGLWRKIKIVPEKKPTPIPAGALDKGTPA